MPDSENIVDNASEKPVVLYVEDDDASVFLLQTALTEVGADVDMIRMRNGEEASAWLNHSGSSSDAPVPSLILLDLNLPRKSGLEVLAEIHATPSLRAIPVVVFSSSSLEVDKRRSFELGARDYIKKPPTFAAFVEAIRSACAFLTE